MKLIWPPGRNGDPPGNFEHCTFLNDMTKSSIDFLLLKTIVYMFYEKRTKFGQDEIGILLEIESLTKIAPSVIM